MKHLRILSLILAAMMAFSVLPASFAEGAEEEPTQEIQQETKEEPKREIQEETKEKPKVEPQRETEEMSKVEIEEESKAAPEIDFDNATTEEIIDYVLDIVPEDVAEELRAELSEDVSEVANTRLPDNPENSTIQRVSDPMDNNYGTIVNHNGCLTLNSGTVNTNENIDHRFVEGWICINENIVESNEACVFINIGTVVSNKLGVCQTFGKIVTNEENGEVDEVMNKEGRIGSIETNKGKVNNNFGIITMNTVSGTVKKNEGEVDTNDGTITLNTEKGMITTNNGTVTTNGKVSVINTNNGTVKNNEKDAMINTNNGTITSNAGIVSVNNAGAEIGKNNGTITINEGSVQENNGTVSVNAVTGTIVMTSDTAAVESNAGVVINGKIETAENIPFGERVVTGSDVIVGISYGTKDALNITPGETGSNYLKQWDATAQKEGITILSYDMLEDYLGGMKKGKEFVAWKGSDGKKYKPGQVYSTAEALQLIAVFKSIVKEEKKKAASAPALTVTANKDRSISVKGGKASKFVGITVDNEPIDASLYELVMDENGLLRLIFLEAFLESLFSGDHKIEICFSNGTASITLAA